ncbi:MAG: hypothetical protein ACM30G_07190 [Micromonosporaceae bacterium]
MDVSSAVIRRLLVSRGVSSTVDFHALLDASRSPSHKLAITLLSCWATEGHALDASQRAELDAYRDRADRYAGIWARLRVVAPTAHLVKGPVIAAHYPVGVVRAAGDLDIVDPDPAELWQAAAMLAADGWWVAAFTVLPYPGGHDVLLSMQQASSGPIADAYEVELRTPDVATSLTRTPVRFDPADDVPVASSIVALAAERFERRFASRDILDLGVLSAELTDAGRAALTQALTAARLWPAYQQLCRLLDRADLPGRGPLPQDRPLIRRQRISGPLHVLRTWSHPLRAAALLAISTADVDRGRVADRFTRTLHERFGARRLLLAGVPLFGVPVDDHRTDALRLVDRGHRLIARTPVGTFLLTAGACPQEWLSDLATPAEAAT